MTATIKYPNTFAIMLCGMSKTLPATRTNLPIKPRLPDEYPRKPIANPAKATNEMKIL